MRGNPTSLAQAARPELLEGGLLAPHPMDFTSGGGGSFFFWFPPFCSLFFSGFSLDLKLKPLEADGGSSPNKASETDRLSDGHPLWSPAPRMKQKLSTFSLTYLYFPLLALYLKCELCPSSNPVSNNKVPSPSLSQNLHLVNIKSLPPYHIQCFCITSSLIPHLLCLPQDGARLKPVVSSLKSSVAPFHPVKA